MDLVLDLVWRNQLQKNMSKTIREFEYGLVIKWAEQNIFNIVRCDNVLVIFLKVCPCLLKHTEVFMGEMMSYLGFAVQYSEKNEGVRVRRNNIDKCWSWWWVYTSSWNYFFFLVLCMFKSLHNEKYKCLLKSPFHILFYFLRF